MTAELENKAPRRKAKKRNFSRSRVTVVDLGSELTDRVKALARENEMTVAMATRFLIRKAFLDAEETPMIIRIPAKH